MAIVRKDRHSLYVRYQKQIYRPFPTVGESGEFTPHPTAEKRRPPCERSLRSVGEKVTVCEALQYSTQTNTNYVLRGLVIIDGEVWVSHGDIGYGEKSWCVWQ